MATATRADSGLGLSHQSRISWANCAQELPPSLSEAWYVASGSLSSRMEPAWATARRQVIPTRCQFRHLLLAPISALNTSCGVSNTTQREWIVEPAPAFISPPVIPQPLVECAASVHVTGLEPGAHVQLYSKQLGAPIGEVFAISKSHNISIAPALIVGDQITAVQSGCGHTSHSSPVELQRLGDLPLPTIQPLPTDGARAVSVRHVAPGARVDLYVNDLFAGSSVATSSNVAVPIVEGHPALQINQKVYARQQ